MSQRCAPTNEKRKKRVCVWLAMSQGRGFQHRGQHHREGGKGSLAVLISQSASAGFETGGGVAAFATCWVNVNSVRASLSPCFFSTPELC